MSPEVHNPKHVIEIISVHLHDSAELSTESVVPFLMANHAVAVWAQPNHIYFRIDRLRTMQLYSLDGYGVG